MAGASAASLGRASVRTFGCEGMQFSSCRTSRPVGCRSTARCEVCGSSFARVSCRQAHGVSRPAARRYRIHTQTPRACAASCVCARGRSRDRALRRVSAAGAQAGAVRRRSDLRAGLCPAQLLAPVSSDGSRPRAACRARNVRRRRNSFGYSQDPS